MLNKIHKYFNEFKIGTKTMFKEFFNKETNKKQRANMWTFSRLILSIFITICSIFALSSMNPVLFSIASGLTGFGAITDFFDGRSARKYNSCSEYGKLLDQVTDKFFTTLISICLVFINPLFLTVILGEGLISVVNIMYENKYGKNGLNIKSSQIGRIKQWPLSASLIIAFLSPISKLMLTITNILISTTNFMQLLAIGSYIKENNEKIKKLNNIDKNIKDTCLENIKEKQDKEKILEFTKNKSNTEVRYNNKQKLEQYYKLRDTLNNVINKKSDEENYIENDQKQLKK